MSRPNRNEQFQAGEVCIVHAIQRCVRRAFLTGVDPVSGKDYSFRREWIRRRMEALASAFGIDVLTYAILSSHLHIILRNRPDVVALWSEEEVAQRWLKVFPGRRFEEHLAEPTEADVQALIRDQERMAVIRSRLSDISWFMRALAEPVARLANAQEKCTGRFWEGRFKAQRLADEAGLLACAMYVDLNPIRAAMAESPEQAEHTSAYDRIQAERGAKIDSAAFDLRAVPTAEAGKKIRETPVQQRMQEQKAKRRNPTGKRVLRDSWLAPLELASQTLSNDPQAHAGGLRASDRGFLCMDWSKYLELLQWTAAQRIKQAASKVPQRLQSALASTGIEVSMWRDLVWDYKRYFGRSTCAGRPSTMSADARRHNRRCHHGQQKASECFLASG
ncbi:hypothetical protein [Aureliella helgolandensis]|uniref:Transposase IS200-like domain-containing protein n=1 Tax=Aureliella helgolandensis TaxID=2527968 RepID=A0A518G359_9BACT|nr:hypothetical protein [Aureliella helgolandensis]QDV23041.1 hypothetical protein Q31a_13350 [Aureliella helgolandensis]QDV23970.1 hypothetical protein Q31a_22830 [Aureliella helgolandensis]